MKLRVIKLGGTWDYWKAMDRGIKVGERFIASLKIKKRRRLFKATLEWVNWNCDCCGGYYRLFFNKDVPQCTG